MAVLDRFAYCATINAGSAGQAVGKSRGIRSSAERNWAYLSRPVWLPIEHDRGAEQERAANGGPQSSQL